MAAGREVQIYTLVSSCSEDKMALTKQKQQGESGQGEEESGQEDEESGQEVTGGRGRRRG